MDRIDELLRNRGEAQPQQDERPAMDGQGDELPAVDRAELTGEVGRRMRALVEKRRSDALARYAPLIRKLAQGKALDDDEVIVLADSTRALGYPLSRPDDDVRVVQDFQKCRAAGAQLAKLKKELAVAAAARDGHYDKLLRAIEEQKRLGGIADELENRLRFLQLDAERGERMLAGHPDLLG